MSESRKEKADKIRLEILALTDEELVYFGHAVHSGEIEVKPFETVTQFIKRAADEHFKSMPF